MSPPFRKPRPFKRDPETLRDANLLVIATEDTHLPAAYFAIFRNRRIQIVILPSEEGLSSPKHVMDRMAAFKNEHQLAEDDELWLTLDIDHWTRDGHVANFSKVCAEAKKMGASLAHSNPCFELWLLLHLTELDPSDQLKSYGEVRDRIIALVGSCSKQTLDVTKYTLAAAALAVERAEKLDRNPDHRWPEKTGTHVYRIVKRLLT